MHALAYDYFSQDKPSFSFKRSVNKAVKVISKAKDLAPMRSNRIHQTNTMSPSETVISYRS